MASSILPVHRPEERTVFNPPVDRAARSSRVRAQPVGRLKDRTLVAQFQNMWNLCTTTLDGSLSETFKLGVSSDNGYGDDWTSASGMRSAETKMPGNSDSFLDAVVVESNEEKPRHLHQSVSAQHSGHGGSSSPGHAIPDVYPSGLGDDKPYQGRFRSWICDRGWSPIADFFEPRFAEQEEEYQIQSWHSAKILAFFASLFLVLNWVLYLILNNHSTSNSLYAKIVYWGGLSLFTLPTPFMVALDMPRRSPILFQMWFCIAVWYCAFAEVVQMRLCRFFTDNHCFGKDFLAMSYYATGLPALMMFVVSKRVYNLIAQLIFFILLVVLIIPVQAIYARNVVVFAVFSIFIQGLDYYIENCKRRMFLLAVQLQKAYEATDRARLAESKASFIKRRFANYIFHEVRVPLNNAVLAFQLLQSGNAFKDDHAKSTEVYALEQGLTMMKTVLNDVLDFEKMDSGHFETVAKPFPLHRSISRILDQVEVQTGARKLILERALDAQIDNLPRLLEVGASYEPEGLWVLGSELRLHQVLTNLATNAVKYTPEAGGSIRISTEFLGVLTREQLPGTWPGVGKQPRSGEKRERTRWGAASEDHEGCAAFSARPAEENGAGRQLQCLKFRMEVADPGPGIKPSDLVEDRLFQPFSQTTVGRASGSGTGLGLAIVKQIIRLSGGRLGVTSRRGEGSKFWVELTYPLASTAEVKAAREANALTELPQLFRDWKTASGFIEGPLVAAGPQVSDKFLGDVVSEVVPAVSTPSTPAPRSPMPPRYERTPGVQLPRPPQDTASTPAAGPATPTSESLRVLVVDDNAHTRALSSKLLTKLGCVVQTANDGRQCVDMLLGSEPHMYDLICLDNFMPVMTGEEAVKELRANDRTDFVVGCTGNALTEDQNSYLEAGADEVLVKPVMIHDFKRLIQIAQQRRLDRRAGRAPSPT